MIITSFSQKGYHQYGKNFILEFLENWPDEELTVYYERGYPSSAPQDERLTWVNLYDFKDFKRFEDRLNSSDPLFGGVMHIKQEDATRKPVYNFRFDARRFYRKVWCMEHMSRQEGVEKFAWVDADVQFVDKAPENFLENLFTLDDPTKELYIVHLNREWLYSETGFIAFRTDTEIMSLFFAMAKNTYLSGAFRYLGEWHDCYVLDLVMRQLDVPRGSLVQDEKSDHVFNDSMIGQFMIHNKGPERKKAAQDDPEGNKERERRIA